MLLSMETNAQILLTNRDVARLLQCSERHVRDLAREGYLPPPIKFGRLARWRRADVDEAIEKLANARTKREGDSA